MADEEKARPKKDGLSVMMIGILLFLVVVLGASLVIVVLVLGNKGSAPVSSTSKNKMHIVRKRKEEKKKPGILVPLGGDIIVNLAESGGATYLKVNAVLEVNDPKAVEEVKARAPEIRDLMIGILRLKTAEKISGKEGINEIRSEIIRNINHQLDLDEGKVINIYFSDFIMQ